MSLYPLDFYNFFYPKIDALYVSILPSEKLKDWKLEYQVNKNDLLSLLIKKEIIEEEIKPKKSNFEVKKDEEEIENKIEEKVEEKMDYNSEKKIEEIDDDEDDELEGEGEAKEVSKKKRKKKKKKSSNSSISNTSSPSITSTSPTSTSSCSVLSTDTIRKELVKKRLEFNFEHIFKFPSIEEINEYNIYIESFSSSLCISFILTEDILKKSYNKEKKFFSVQIHSLSEIFILNSPINSLSYLPLSINFLNFFQFNDKNFYNNLILPLSSLPIEKNFNNLLLKYQNTDLFSYIFNEYHSYDSSTSYTKPFSHLIIGDEGAGSATIARACAYHLSIPSISINSTEIVARGYGSNIEKILNQVFQLVYSLSKLKKRKKVALLILEDLELLFPSQLHDSLQSNSIYPSYFNLFENFLDPFEIDNLKNSLSSFHLLNSKIICIGITKNRNKLDKKVINLFNKLSYNLERLTVKQAQFCLRESFLSINPSFFDNINKDDEEELYKLIINKIEHKKLYPFTLLLHIFQSYTNDIHRYIIQFINQLSIPKLILDTKNQENLVYFGFYQISSIIQELFVWPIKYKKIYQSFGLIEGNDKDELNGNIYSHILLRGPSGSGKSFLPFFISKELNYNYLEVHLQNLIQGEIGAGEGHILKSFNEAKRNAPCILFFDQVNLLFPNSTSDSSSLSTTLLSTFLACLEDLSTWHKVSPNAHVLVIASSTTEVNLKEEGKAEREDENYQRIFLSGKLKPSQLGVDERICQGLNRFSNVITLAPYLSNKEIEEGLTFYYKKYNEILFDSSDLNGLKENIILWRNQLKFLLPCDFNFFEKKFLYLLQSIFIENQLEPIESKVGKEKKINYDLENITTMKDLFDGTIYLLNL